MAVEVKEFKNTI